MGLYHFFSVRIATRKMLSFLLLMTVAALLLSACSGSRLSASRGLAPGSHGHTSTTVGALNVEVLSGGYGDMALQLASSHPNLSEEIDVASAAFAGRQDMSRPGLFTPSASIAALAMTIGTTDFSGAAAQINTITAATGQHAVRSWRAVEANMQPELGATALATTDGERAFLLKSMGSPLVAGLEAGQVARSTTPTVRVYQPTSGTGYDFIAAGPVLSAHEFAAVNERGLAMTVTSIEEGSPELHDKMAFKFRRILQSSANVEQALQKFYSDDSYDTGAHVLLADAGGNIAHLECTQEACSELLFKNFGPGVSMHTTHGLRALSDAAVPLSFDQLGLESRLRLAAAQQEHDRLLGNGFEVSKGVQFLRSLAPTHAINGHGLTNALVSGGVILDPFNQTLWHSTGEMPVATFAKWVEVGFSGPTGQEVHGQLLSRETQNAYLKLVQAEAQFSNQRYGEALGLLESMPESLAIDRRKLAYFKALNLAALGQLDQAADQAITASNQHQDSNLSAHAHLLRAWVFNQQNNLDMAHESMRMAQRAVSMGLVNGQAQMWIARQEIPLQLGDFPSLLGL